MVLFREPPLPGWGLALSTCSPECQLDLLAFKARVSESMRYLMPNHPQEPLCNRDMEKGRTGAGKMKQVIKITKSTREAAFFH